jgi:hypothetical protein
MPASDDLFAVLGERHHHRPQSLRLQRKDNGLHVRGLVKDEQGGANSS